MLQIIWLSALLMAALALAIMAVLIVLRVMGQYRDARRQHRRNELLKVLLSWLDGRIADAVLKSEIARKRAIATELLIEIFELVRGGDQERLGRLAEETGLPRYMRETLEIGPKHERIRAAESLVWFPSQETRAILRFALLGRDPDVGLAAAKSLASLGETLPVRDLLERQLRPGADAPRQLEAVLAGLAPRQQEDLLALARDDAAPERIRVAALDALSRTGSFDLVEPIAALAEAPAPPVRAAVARALGLLGHPAAEGTILALLSDPDWHVRAEAAEAAQRIGLTHASKQLESLLGDENWWVRLRAGEALASFGDAGTDILRRLAAAYESMPGRMAALILAERGLA